MHITEDFFAEFNEINKKRRGETSFLSVKTLMLNERKNRSDCSVESA